jgi:hypothetical protein
MICYAAGCFYGDVTAMGAGIPDGYGRGRIPPLQR